MINFDVNRNPTYRSQDKQNKNYFGYEIMNAKAQPRGKELS